MLKQTLVAVLLSASSIAIAASTYTSHYNLEKAQDGTVQWGPSIRNAFDTIDNQMFVNQASVNNHVNATTAAHLATAISTVAGTTCPLKVNVQTFLACLDSAVALSAKASDLTALTTRVTNAESTLGGHTTLLSTHTSQLSDHESRITSNTSNLATHTTQINANTSQISSLNSQVTTNTNNIATNTSNISTNTSNISANQSAIASHISNTSGAHAASAISVSAGTLCSTASTVQQFLGCLDTNFASLSGGSVMTLNTAQTVTGQKTFTPAIIANGGVTGNLSGNVSGATGAFTTSITTPTIINTGTLTLPTATDTLTGRQTTDTLTNKTLAVGSNSITGSTGTVPQFNATTGKLEASSTTATELTYLSGVTSSLQTQLNGKQASGSYQATGNYITALTGDVTASGPGSSAATISGLARTKLASGTASHVVINDGTGALSSEATLAKVRGGAGADMSNVTFPSTGTLDTTSGTATLTNKTLTGNTAANFVNGGATITLPSATGTLATLGNAETLTNKTIAVGLNSITGTVAKTPQFNATTGALEASAVSNTELGYLSGVTSAIQPQLNGKITAGSAAIVNADVSASAAIARTKLASGTASQVLINDGSGVMTSEAQLAGTRGGTGVSSTATYPTSGVIDTTTSTATLTGKTMSGANNTFTAIGAGSISSGASAAGTYLRADGSGNAAFSAFVASVSVVTKTAAYTLTTADDVVLASAGSAFTLTLPTAVGNTGKLFRISKVDTSANLVTVATTSSQTIGKYSTASTLLAVQGDVIEVISDGANWQYVSDPWRVISARVTPASSSSCTVAQYGGAFAAPTANAVGVCFVNFPTGLFADTPNCVANSEDTGAQTVFTSTRVAGSSATQVLLRQMYFNSGSSTVASLGSASTMICRGPR